MVDVALRRLAALVFGYLPSYLTQVTGLSTTQSFAVTLTAVTLTAVAALGAGAVLGGILVDRTSPRVAATSCAIAIGVTAQPAFLIIQQGTVVSAILGPVPWAIFLGVGGVVGASPALHLFPTPIRLHGQRVRPQHHRRSIRRHRPLPIHLAGRHHRQPDSTWAVPDIRGDRWPQRGLLRSATVCDAPAPADRPRHRVLTRSRVKTMPAPGLTLDSVRRCSRWVDRPARAGGATCPVNRALRMKGGDTAPSPGRQRTDRGPPGAARGRAPMADGATRRVDRRRFRRQSTPAGRDARRAEPGGRDFR